MNIENDLTDVNESLPKFDNKVKKLITFFTVIKAIYSFARETAIIICLIKILLFFF